MVKLKKLEELYEVHCKTELEITDSVRAKLSWENSRDEDRLSNILSGSIATERDSVYNASCNISSDEKRLNVLGMASFGKKIQVQYGDGFPTNGNREISLQASFGNLIGNFRSVWSTDFDDADESEEVDSDAIKPEKRSTHTLEAKTTYYQPVSKSTSISGTVGINEMPRLSLEHSFTDDGKNGVRLEHEILSKCIGVAIRMKSADKHHSLKASLSASQNSLSTEKITYKLKAFDGFKAKATINVEESAYECSVGWTSSNGGEFIGEVIQPFAKDDERSITVLKRWTF